MSQNTPQKKLCKGYLTEKNSDQLTEIIWHERDHIAKEKEPTSVQQSYLFIVLAEEKKRREILNWRYFQMFD